MLISQNPYTGELLQKITPWSDEAVADMVTRVNKAQPEWAVNTSLADRCQCLRNLAEELRNHKTQLASLATQEMGKLYPEALAEVEKSALVCDYYADEAPAMLANEMVATEARKSYITHQPLGTILAIMPWNFPFWQVFRFLAPALVAGNTALLKHASNVPQCAQAIQERLLAAGFPQYVFANLPINANQVEAIIRHPRVHAVSLTGSEPAGRQVAAIAGSELKKSVLELGGSDAFIVLDSFNIQRTLDKAVNARFINNGQSCIAAKRFIVDHNIADAFVAGLVQRLSQLRMGDPMDNNTQLGPMARHDLRDELHDQVMRSVAAGAQLKLGGFIPPDKGAFYPATLLDYVDSSMPAYHEELFGPVVTVIRVRDIPEALAVANDSAFGLGGSIWTDDRTTGETLAQNLQVGCAFVNDTVRSHPKLPFGGVKNSGYGRELSRYGLLEWVNTKSIWIG